MVRLRVLALDVAYFLPLGRLRERLRDWALEIKSCDRGHRFSGDECPICNECPYCGGLHSWDPIAMALADCDGKTKKETAA